MNRLYAILAVILVVAGIYGYGHHKGWKERDAEMQAEIAVKNEESRAKEREMNEIHIESGYKLNGSMLRENCVDELLLYYAPFLMGDGIGMANMGPLPNLDQRQDWQIIDQCLIGSDLRLRLIRN